MEKRTSLFDNGLIWFGAGVSIAEILTGTYFASLGFKKGLLAILLGHLIGAVPFLLAGMISGYVRKSAMETVKMSFGSVGGQFFALMNVIQLVGWTAIMIYDGSISASTAIHGGRMLWCLVIGGLIIVWILIGITNLGKVNTIAMALLFILTLVLCRLIFFSGASQAGTEDGSLTFGAAVELAVSMPLSWLPVVGDYTRDAEDPGAASVVSTIVYSIVSIWMFVIGMGAAIFTGSSDIAEIMLRAGLGIAGLLIIVFSTVTTTFLDAMSAGISCESLVRGLDGKGMAVAATVIGTVGAILFNMDDITSFLYFIGSVFAPMTAVMIVNYFLLDRDSSDDSFDLPSMLVWVVGFILYRVLMRVDTPVGNTLPDMVITGILAYVIGRFTGRRRRY